jgi:hypothetical protein
MPARRRFCARLFRENFNQKKFNHAASLNRSGSKSHTAHCLHGREGGMRGDLVSNLMKDFRSGQSLAVMLAKLTKEMLTNEMACS